MSPTIILVTPTKPHIGTLREKHLHAALKRWYSEAGDRVEIPVDGFVIDIVRDDLLIEVQTRGFSSMHKKVRTLLDLGHQIRIVHPIAVDRWIVKVDDQGTILDRRRSPKHGVPTDIFSELVSFPDLIADPGLELEIVLTTEAEYRRHTPGRSWRRKGWSVTERRLIEVLDTVRIEGVEDLVALLPEELPVSFTTADLAEATGRPRRVAQQAAYCLRKVGAISEVDKNGNAVVYQIT